MPRRHDLEVRYRSDPPAGLVALHRTWWIRWTYGEQDGVVYGRTCCCAVLCQDFSRLDELAQVLRLAITAGIARQHGVHDHRHSP